MSNVRVRFAPSPTGGLHLGGVRTALFNYLFARHNDGKFILRIEDTDQTRFVEGAEEYIYDCLRWCGISPDESPETPGDFGPYRQSDRKPIYREFAEKLVTDGHAYYAFDTPEEIENLRNQLKSEKKDNLQYGHQSRMRMKNSLTLSKEEVDKLIQDGTPYVIRLKVEPNETIHFKDMIRGDIDMSTDTVDDKVLLKTDGMPTYHLAVVVDDHKMEVTNIFRGEEWLPSAPVQVLVYKYLGWESEMPQFAHLPLILKPDGNGKLSKRDGERLGFPVFAMTWDDPVQGHVAGFKELGFLPQAFINMLAALGWNDGTEQEIYTLDEMVEKFTMDRVHSHGAKFNFDKAKWFNQQWLKLLPAKDIIPHLIPFLQERELEVDEHDEKLERIVEITKTRCTLLPDFVSQVRIFYETPMPDKSLYKDDWNPRTQDFFQELMMDWDKIQDWKHDNLYESAKALMTRKELKGKAVLLPLRIMLVGANYGPSLYDIAELIGKEETMRRLNLGIMLVS